MNFLKMKIDFFDPRLFKKIHYQNGYLMKPMELVDLDGMAPLMIPINGTTRNK